VIDHENGQPGRLACVIAAHTDPAQVRRLVAALDPFPVFLHCDVATGDEVFRQMTEGLPARVTLLPRRRTPWANWANVALELEGIRAAVETTDATHIAVMMTGTDYPLASTEEIAGHLGTIRGTSVTDSQPLPLPQWGRGGGAWRLRYRFWAWRKRIIWLPLPRRLPRGVVPAGGSQQKLLSREHAEALLRAVDRRPELARFWRRTWIPEETFVHSVLHTPELVPGFEEQRLVGHSWYIGWDGGRHKSPPFLTAADLPELQRQVAEQPGGVPKLLARKFSTSVDTAVLDEIDRSLRGLAPADV
jgi:hypothetical protein